MWKIWIDPVGGTVFAVIKLLKVMEDHSEGPIKFQGKVMRTEEEDCGRGWKM